MNKPCLILMPVGSVIEPQTQDCVNQLMNRGYPVRQLRGCSQIDLARSIMATEAMELGFEETFWVDSDVVFHPDDVEKIREHKLPFAAGLYPKKGVPEFAGSFTSGNKTVMFGVGGGLVQMKSVGMGFTHIRAEVYRAVAAKLPTCNIGSGKRFAPYFLPLTVPDRHMGDGHIYLGEDAAFCHRAEMAGFPPQADTTIRLGHVHKRALTWDDFPARESYESMQVGIGTQQ